MSDTIPDEIFTEFPTLETERLLLRQQHVSDANDYFELRTDNAGMRYMDVAPPKTVEEIQAKLNEEIEAFKGRRGILWTIVKKDTSEFVGDVGYWRLMKKDFRGEIAYQILPKHWRCGYAAEALGAAIEYGFTKMKLHSIEANCNPANVPSINLLTKLGFVQEAYFRENYYYDGRFLDSAVFSLLVSRWYGAA